MAKTIEELRQISVAPLPSPGQGLALGPDGKIPASLVKSLPGYEIGYDQTVTGATVSSTTEATGTTVISCAAHSFDGAPVWVEFFAPFIQPAAVAGAFVVVNLFESTTQIGRLLAVTDPVAAAAQNTAIGKLRFTPTLGIHTYTVTAFQGGGNGVIGAGTPGTAAYVPAYIGFTKA